MSAPQEWRRLAWAMYANDLAVDEPAVDADLAETSLAEWRVNAEASWGPYARDFIAHTDALARMRAEALAARLATLPPEKRADIRIPWPLDEATVEKVARALHNLGHPDGCYCGALGWEAWASDARAVLDALGTDDA